MSVIHYEHWFEDCAEHENCCVHVGEGENEQGEFRTESHLSADIDPAFRLNLDYPDADDRREGAAKADRVQWKLADDAAIAHEEFPWTDETRKHVAALAVAKGLGDTKEMARIAKMPEAALGAAAAEVSRALAAADA